MATDTQQPAAATSGYSAPRRTSGGAGRLFFGIVGALALLGLAAYGANQFLAEDETDVVKRLTHVVDTDDLMITVMEDGNLESANNVDIKCQVAGGSSILWIVEDGKEVEEGEKLVELDKSAIEDQISQQTITNEKARSAMIQAEKDYQVAVISVEEYLQGTYKIELQDAEAQITIAEENLRSSKNAVEHSQRMFRRGYISSLELESQHFAVKHAQLELDSATTAKEVLEKFSKVKMLEDLSSQVETAKAKMESEKAAFDLEDARLKRLKDQLEHCLIVAPQAGMVVYANDAGRGRFGSSSGPQIEEGAQVRERQNILQLPDLNRMQVKVNVHETKVDSLARGMRASIKIQDKNYQGTVVSVANQPEPSSFFSASVKEYATTVRIDGEPRGLKPGMTAEVEILVAHLKDVIAIPVAAVVEQRGQFYGWVLQNDQPVRRPLVLGLSNDQFVEVKDGLAQRDVVLLNPRAVVSEARGGDGEPEVEESVEDKFGQEQTDTPETPTGDPGGERPGGGPAAGGSGGGRGPGGDGGGGEGGRGGRGNLMSNDADGDGKISREEAPERMQSFFDRLDSNGDGFIEESEISAMRGGGGGGPGGPGGGPGGGR